MSYLLWLDTETTGLYPRSDVLLSVGSIVTTADLKTVGEFSADIGFDIDLDGYRGQIDPFVLEMHTKNGQWDRSKKSPFTKRDVLLSLFEFWSTTLPVGAKAYLAGSTVWFDREFISAAGYDLRSLPYMQYRMLDVSTFKVLGDLYGIEKEKAPEAHQVLPDLRQSIADLKWWAERLYLLDENMQLTLDGRGDLVGDP